MIIGATHVSQVSRGRLKAKFQRKVDVLRDIVKSGEWSAGPQRPSMSAFCKWTSSEPLVEHLSHSAIYKIDVDEFARLRKEAVELLKSLKNGRAGRRSSGRKTIASLTSELANEKKLSQSFLDQLTMTRAALETEQAEVARLKGDIEIIRASGGKVVPIRRIRKSPKGRRSQ